MNEHNTNKDTLCNLIVELLTNKECIKLIGLFTFIIWIAYLMIDPHYSSMINKMLVASVVAFTIALSSIIIFTMAVYAIKLPRTPYNLAKIMLCISGLIIAIIFAETYLSNLQNKNLLETQNICYDLKANISETNKLMEYFGGMGLDFLSKLAEFVGIASLVGFISSYHPEKSDDNPKKSESKNEQADNTTENNQTDTTKPEPEQSSEEKESPHG